MLVYGDPHFSTTAGTLVERLRTRLKILNPACLDDWRTFLIQAGQLEQGLSDCSTIDADLITRAVELTDIAARRFCRLWQASGVLATESVVQSLTRLGSVLQDSVIDPALIIKVPEGFAFYALYPEQYCAAALSWASEHPKSARALVVGIRSIGTSLSAVVKETLAAAGWNAQRVTVRPTGHPFDRRLEWDFSGMRVDSVLVVDEGPGISGSSMAAVAQACDAAGIHDISFLPGHDGEPGAAASAEVRAIWRRTRRFFVPLELSVGSNDSMGVGQNTDRRFITEHASPSPWPSPLGRGKSCIEFVRSSRIGNLIQRSDNSPTNRELATTHFSSESLRLQEFLAIKAQDLQGDHSPFDAVEDLSGGLWRHFAFADESDWPAVAGQFERMKFLCVRRKGNSVLWKFAGLHTDENGQSASDAAWQQLSLRAEAGFTRAPLGAFGSFVAMPWIEGNRLSEGEAADDFVLSQIGRYIVHAAGPGLSSEVNEAAITRLAEMLYWNTKEVLGDSAAEQTRAFADAARAAEAALSYGDGHLAPHEWIRTRDNVILKLDCEGHAADHTLVGKQSVLWDIAGALVEWGLNPAAASPLLAVFREAGVRTDFEVLKFYRIAYAAFRMGLFSLGIQQTGDAAEKDRLRIGGDFYLAQLERLLRQNETAVRGRSEST